MKHNYFVKNIIAIAALAMAAIAPAAAQDLSSYFMTGAIDRVKLNASFAPDRGYFNIPMVGNISLSSSGNMSLGDIILSDNGELKYILDTTISADQALSGLNEVNNFGVDNRISILGFGGYSKDRKSFWSFDVNLRTSANFAMPYSLFEFIKEAPDYAQISDVNIYMESYGEVAFGYSRPINDRLTVGMRVKGLVGLASASLNIDKLDVTLSSDEWKAEALGSLNLNVGGVEIESELNEGGDQIYQLDDISIESISPAGYGAAIDLGATYQFSDRLTFSAAVNDLGFISWSKGCNTSAQVSNDFSFSGADVTVDDGGATVAPSDETINFEELEFVAEDSESTMKLLQANILAAAEYKMFHNRLGVGAIYSARFWETKSVHNMTAAVTYSPLNWLSVGANYSFTNNQANALGLALNLSTGIVNLYVATDVLTSKKSAQYIPIDQSMMNVSFGLAFSMGKGERQTNARGKNNVQYSN